MIDVLQLIILALFTSLVSIGVYCVCRADTDLILSFIGKWYEKLINRREGEYRKTRKTNEFVGKCNENIGCRNYSERYYWLVNPLFYCPYCMSSFWSVLIYICFIPITWKCLVELPLQMLAVLTFNSILIKIFYPHGL